jgi:ABC-type antimicrobial peptide transport system permease subunit
MQEISTYVSILIGVAALTALAIVGLRLKKSAVRVNRALDPLKQKAKTLNIETSALKRSRLERQRRLESTSNKDRNPNQ